MTDINYFVTESSGADLLDFHDDEAALFTLGGVEGTYSIAGQEFAVTGQAAVNRVSSSLGVDVDVSGLLASADVIFLDGAWADYTKDTTSVSGAIVFTRTVGGATETVTVGNGAISLTRDLLVFSDGAVRTDTVRKALAADGLSATVQDLIDEGAATTTTTDDDWDSGVTSASPGATLPATLSGTVSGIAAVATGVEFAMAMPGVAHNLTGGGGADSSFVTPGATVNATALLGGQDIVYFAGAWADYAKDTTSVSGAIVFTRTVGGVTETVTVGNGAISLTRDLLVFSDGAVRTDTVRKALAADGLSATVQDLIDEGAATTTTTDDDWDATTFTRWGANSGIALSNAELDAVAALDVRSDVTLTAAESVSLVDAAQAAGLTITFVNIDDTSRNIVLDLSDAADRGRISFADGGTSGTLIRIDPTFDLDVNSNYRLEVSAGAFVNAASEGSAALGSSNGITFTTVTPGAAAAATSQVYAFTDSGSDGWDAATLGASDSWWDISGQGSAGNPATKSTVEPDFTGGGFVAYAGRAVNVATGEFAVADDTYWASILNFGNDDLIYFDDQDNDANSGTFVTDATQTSIELTTFGNGPGGNELNIAVVDGANTATGIGQARIHLTLDTTAGFTAVWADDAAFFGASPVMVA